VNCIRLDSICPLAPADVEGGREFVSMQTNGDPVCVAGRLLHISALVFIKGRRRIHPHPIPSMCRGGGSYTR
jgi:hypothetical protein